MIDYSTECPDDYLWWRQYLYVYSTDYPQTYSTDNPNDCSTDNLIQP